jgi:hypothetical protein
MTSEVCFALRAVAFGRGESRAWNLLHAGLGIACTERCLLLRWYPTPTLWPDHRISVFGGSIATNEISPSADVYEMWDPADPTKKPLEEHLVEPDFLKAVVQVRRCMVSWRRFAS